MLYFTEYQSRKYFSAMLCQSVLQRWGVDLLSEKLISEIGDWIWKTPFAHDAVGGRDAIQSLLEGVKYYL